MQSAATFVVMEASSPISLARVDRNTGPVIRVAAIQHTWDEDSSALSAKLERMVALAASRGAQVVQFPELTLSRYPADQNPGDNPGDGAEDLLTGPTVSFARACAQRHAVTIIASLYRKSPAADGLGANTSIIVSPTGELIGATDKIHIPRTAGYREDLYFRSSTGEDPLDGDGETRFYPVVTLPAAGGARIGVPTCWDQWFPEVSRIYALEGAELLFYPTAIGSEPDHPQLDTCPLWRNVIIAQGIMNGLFMVVANRTGDEGGNRFYGSSFISDPYGRVLVEAPRDQEAVIIADVDLAQGKDWLDLFPFHATREPRTYGRLSSK